MISTAAITEWRHNAPWIGNDQVEHDLALSRAICELYQHPLIQEQLVFRGGTALHKLFTESQGRFSEDLDFVQMEAGPIGELSSAIRSCLDHWLGTPKWKQNQGRFTLNYNFETETTPIMKRKVKIEINTREHFTTHGHIKKTFQIENQWYSGIATVTTYSLEELIGTKLRALYQRKKGRDLYDLWFVLENHPNLDIDALINAYQSYMKAEGTPATRAEFEKNLHQKRQDRVFQQDISSLLPVTHKNEYDLESAFDLVHTGIISRLPGEPWKGKV